MSVDLPVHIGAITGAGSPNYLNSPWSVCVATIGGTEYAFVVADVDDALTAFDISTPATPVRRDTIIGANSPNYLDGAWCVFVATVGVTEYAFVASRRDHALTIFDVSTPATLTHVGYIDGAGSPNYLNDVRSVFVAPVGGVAHAFLASRTDNALSIVNVSNPAIPVHAGFIAGTGSPNYLERANSVFVMTIGGTEYAFVASYNSDALSIFDVSTPATPVLIKAITGLNGAVSVYVAVIGGTEYAFVLAAITASLTVFDVSTPASATQVGVISGAGSPNYLAYANSVFILTVGGTEYAFVASLSDNALTIFDVSTPATPVHVGAIDGAGSPNYLGGADTVGVMKIGGVEHAMVVSYIDDALTIFDVSAEAVPSLLFHDRRAFRGIGRGVL